MSPTAAPLVSVIIPAFNAGAFISETIESVLAQSYPLREIIVVDDGSTDDTARRIEQYRGAIHAVRQAQGGQAAARNAGLALASGHYVAFLDSDDLWTPDALEVQLAVARRHPESGLIAADGVMFSGSTIMSEHLLPSRLREQLAARPDGEVTTFLYRQMLVYGITCPAQILVPRAVVQELGPMVADRAVSGFWEYTLRITRRYPATAHRHRLVRYRYHSTSAAGALDRRHFRWTLNNVPVLRRELRVCRPEDRAFVRDVLLSTTRQRAREAYHLGRQADRVFALRFLGRLWRLRRADPVILKWLVALRLPASLMALARRWGRGMRG